MRQGDLPIAETISDRLKSFEEFRAFTGKVFRSNNIDVVRTPEWEYSLFHERDNYPKD